VPSSTWPAFAPRCPLESHLYLVLITKPPAHNITFYRKCEIAAVGAGYNFYSQVVVSAALKELMHTVLKTVVRILHPVALGCFLFNLVVTIWFTNDELYKDCRVLSESVFTILQANVTVFHLALDRTILQ